MSLADSLALTILVDDVAGTGSLQAEHGLSFWIEMDCCRILFDSGQGVALWENMAQMGLHAAEIDAVVLSHGHDDHTGAMPRLLRDCRKARFYLHPDALERRYSCSTNGAVRPLGFPLAAAVPLREAMANVVWTREMTRLHPCVFATGEIPRHRPPEAPTDRFFRDSECTRPDTFRDDQALVIETTHGAVVLLGCSHAGVANSVSHALRQSRSGRLHALVGGMHLGSAPWEEVVRLGDLLQELAPRLICPSHCSGAAAKEYFKSRFPDAYREGRAGTTIRLDEAA